MLAEHQAKGKKSICMGKLNPFADKEKCFEFNAFAELIIFVIIESRVKYRDILIEERDERIREREAKEKEEEEENKRQEELLVGGD